MEGVVVNVCSSDLFKSKRAASCLSKRETRFCSNMFVLFVTSHDCAVSQLFLLLCRSSWVRAKIHRVLLLSFFPCVLTSCASAAAGLHCSISWLSSSKIFRFANVFEIYVLSEPCLDHCMGLSLKSVNAGWQNLAAFRRGQEWPWTFSSSAYLQFLRQMRRFCA